MKFISRNYGKILLVLLFLSLLRLPVCISEEDSEIRGVFMKEEGKPNTLQPHNWNAIAELLASYEVNMIVVEAANIDTFFGEEQIPQLISAFHEKNISVHILMKAPYLTSNSSLWTLNHLKEVVHASGDPLRAWTCPTNPGSKLQALKVITEILKYDIDGFMFDFIRYDETLDSCFCDYCKTAFEQYLFSNGKLSTGENLSDDDWTGYYYDGNGKQERLEWRQITVNEWVKDVSTYIKSVKQNVEISAAVFTGTPSWDPKIQVGQDGALWVQNGWLDFVAPMIYIEYPPMYLNIDAFRTMVKLSRGRYAPNNEKPMVVWIETKVEQPLSISLFKETVEVLNEEHVEGYIIWKYGGLEWSDWTDIRPYLEAIQTPTLTPQSSSPSLQPIPTTPPEERPQFLYTIVVIAAFVLISVAIFFLKRRK